MNHRIVSLIASATEIVCALGFESQLVGRSHECDYPPSVSRLPTCSTSKVSVEASSAAIDGQVRAIVGEGLSVYQVDSEVLDRLAPSVIVTQTQCEACAVSLKDVEAAVCELVKSPPAIVSLEPLSLGDVWADIRMVASALGDPAGGDVLVSHLKHRLELLHARSKALAARPSIACIEWIDPLMVAGNWVPELVDRAGGLDLLGEAGRHSGYRSLDQLVSADPDVIVVMPCGFDIERACLEMTPLATHPSWTRLSAVQKGRVFIADGNQYFNRPGPVWLSQRKSLPSACIPIPLILVTRGGDGRAGEVPVRAEPRIRKSHNHGAEQIAKQHVSLIRRFLADVFRRQLAPGPAGPQRGPPSLSVNVPFNLGNVARATMIHHS